jgi:hypothetical protein
MLKDLFESFSHFVELLVAYFHLPKSLVPVITSITTSVLFISTFSVSIYKAVSFFLKKINDKRIDRDLHPFFSHDSVRYYSKNFIKTRLLTISPNNFEELIDVLPFVTKKNSITFKQFYNHLINDESDDRFYFILGESGLGKTTFLMNVFLKYYSGISRGKKYHLRVIPIGNPYALEEIQNLKPKAKDTILIIDGLDEFVFENSAVKDRDDLFNLVWNFRKVVISCRTQFFDSQNDEPQFTVLPKTSETGFVKYRKYYVSPLTASEIKLYLLRLFGLFRIRKRIKGLRIVLSALNLMVRPFLLKNIGYIINENSQSETHRYSLGIYKLLIAKWIKRDVDRIYDRDVKKRHHDHILDMLKELALVSYHKGINENNFYLTNEEITVLADRYEINLEYIKVRSLLNRDNLGNIKFAHKSILEYFIAEEALTNEQLREAIVNNPAFDVAKSFIHEYYFYDAIKNMSNFSGHYFEQNSSQSLTLQKIGIHSMYTIRAVYITDYQSVEFIRYVTTLKKMRELVIAVKCQDFQLWELYYIVYTRWRTALMAINDVLVECYQCGRYINPDLIVLYNALFNVNYQSYGYKSRLVLFEMENTDYNTYIPNTYEINYMFEKIAQMPHNRKYYDEQRDLRIEPDILTMEMDEFDRPLTQIIKLLHNENASVLIKSLSRFTTSDLRTLAKRGLSLVEYEKLRSSECEYVDQLADKILLSLSDRKNIDELQDKLKELDEIKPSEKSRVRIIY